MNGKDLALLGGLGAVAAAGIVALVLHGGAGGRSSLAAVPSDTFLAATIDVREIALSPLAKAFVSSDGTARVPGVGEVEAECGFNPLARVRSISVAVPESGEDGDFGISAVADLSRDELVGCAKKLIAKRGGEASVSTLGSFTVIADGHATGGIDGPKVAFREGGPCLVGRGAWLTRMMDTVEGRAPSLDANADHAALRASLTNRSHGAAVLVTAVLPRSLRDRIRNEMSLSEPDAGRGASLMDGVLGVGSGGLAIHAGTEKEDTAIVAELHCETEAQCTSVRTLLLKQRLALSGNFGVRLAGLGPLIDNFDATVHGPVLVASTHCPASDIATAAERALRPKPKPPAPAPQVPQQSAPPLAPDESLTGKPGKPAHAGLVDAGLALPASKP